MLVTVIRATSEPVRSRFNVATGSKRGACRMEILGRHIFRFPDLGVLKRVFSVRQKDNYP